MYKVFKEIKNTTEFNYAVKKINDWYAGKNISLNIVSVPYNSTLIFEDIIVQLVRRNKRVLYIWNGIGEKKKLMYSIQEIISDISCKYIELGSSMCSIDFVNYKNVNAITGTYDLVIYDDISYYSSLNNEEIKNIYKSLLKKFGKVILYSIEEVEVESEFYLAPISTEKPFVEPRVINTRIDLNKDIPYILYDYLKWFRQRKTRVLLLVPNIENANNIYDYYMNKLKISGVEIFKILNNDSEKIKNEVLKIKDKSIFIITNNMEVMLKDYTVDNAVILFSDDKSFSYKKFLYICAYIGSVNKEMPEVLLVSKDTSIEMDTAKDISRNFNKLIWEKSSK